MKILNFSFKKIPQDVRINENALVYFEVSIHTFNFLTSSFFSFYTGLFIIFTTENALESVAVIQNLSTFLTAVKIHPPNYFQMSGKISNLFA